MLSIKILGPGCFNCMAVEEIVVLSLEQLSGRYPDLEISSNTFKTRRKSISILFLPLRAW